MYKKAQNRQNVFQKKKNKKHNYKSTTPSIDITLLQLQVEILN
jgi:hypothetical protein